MYPTVAKHEMIIETDIRCVVSVDESTITSNSTGSSSDDSSSFEYFYDLDISRLLAFRRSEHYHSIGTRMSLDYDCSEITEQEYSPNESFCDVDELDLVRRLVNKEADPLNLEIVSRRTWRRLQIVGGVCVGISSLLLLLDPQAGRPRRL
jgi:hypothetical protein